MTRKLKKEREKQKSVETQRSREFVNRMCKDKVHYETEMQAFSAGKFAFMGRYFRTYFCQYCGKWHLTTKEKR